MKKLITAAFLAVATATGASAQEVKLQLKWVTQAQFAGYYVAQAKGFYEAEGLNVTILPGGPDIAPTQVIAGGGADVVVEWAAAKMGLPRPPEVDWTDDSVSEAMRRFYLDSKRVSNALAKAELGWRPKYPTWREGLATMLETPPPLRLVG